jgi:hypothetical protein
LVLFLKTNRVLPCLPSLPFIAAPPGIACQLSLLHEGGTHTVLKAKLREALLQAATT